MAGFYLEPKLRPCYVTTYEVINHRRQKKNGELKALFHCWCQESSVIPPSPMMGGHSGGVISGVLGVVEFESGAVSKVSPEDIRFCPGELDKYCFSREGTDDVQ